MAKVSWKPAALLGPLPPVLVSCGDMDKSNIITIAWTGIVSTNPPLTYVSIRKERFSYNIIKDSGEFVINLATKALVRATDFCGNKSGSKVDKFASMHLTKEPATKILCPMISESPLSLECKVKEVREFGTHDMFLAEIVAVNVDETLINKDEKLMLEKAGLITYMHGEYFEQGKPLGSFGYTMRKKTKKPTRK